MDGAPNSAAPDVPAEHHRGDDVVDTAVPIAMLEALTCAKQSDTRQVLGFLAIGSRDVGSILAQVSSPVTFRHLGAAMEVQNCLLIRTLEVFHKFPPDGNAVPEFLVLVVGWTAMQIIKRPKRTVWLPQE